MILQIQENKNSVLIDRKIRESRTPEDN